MASKENKEEESNEMETSNSKDPGPEVIKDFSTQSTDTEQSQSENINQNNEQTSETSQTTNETRSDEVSYTETVTDTSEKCKSGIQEIGENCDSENGETVTFKVIYNKQKFDITFQLDKTVSKLKEHVQTLTGVPSSMQKIMFKGLAKNESTLRDLKVTKGAKVMVVGSTMNDVLQVASKPTQKELEEDTKGVTSKEPLSQQKQHKKVLDKYGKPDDVTPGIKNAKHSLPPHPLSGMYNKSGGKVRLTFKLELDQLWLGTKERTEKLPMNSIKAVVSEPIAGHEEYHLMALQLGPTEASRYWIYWVPAQYVDAIKDTVLGQWQLF